MQEEEKKFTKWPKQDIKLALSPYPEFDSLVNYASFEKRKPKNEVEILLNKDAKWHALNKLRLNVSVKQGVIPALNHFTNEYDH